MIPFQLDTLQVLTVTCGLWLPHCKHSFQCERWLGRKETRGRMPVGSSEAPTEMIRSELGPTGMERR